MRAVVSSSAGRRSRRTSSTEARSAWTDTLAAAITRPDPSRTGADSERRPSSSSWSTMGYPCPRTRSSSARSPAGSVMVNRVSGAGSSLARQASRFRSSCPASSTRPIEVAEAGKRVPARMATAMIREVAARAA